MTIFIVSLSLLFGMIRDTQVSLQDFNVSGIQCQYIAKNVTPQMVEQDVNKFIDTCIQWEGRVFRIAEADPGLPMTKAWVIPVEGKFAYVGSTILKIDLAPSGKIEEYSPYRSLDRCDYLYSHGDLDIRSGDLVSFIGRILGISKKPDSIHKGSSIERALIGITEIHKLLSIVPVKSPLPPG